MRLIEGRVYIARIPVISIIRVTSRNSSIIRCNIYEYRSSRSSLLYIYNSLLMFVNNIMRRPKFFPIYYKILVAISYL